MFGVDDPATVAAVRAYVKLMRAQRGVVARLARDYKTAEKYFNDAHVQSPGNFGQLGSTSNVGMGRGVVIEALRSERRERVDGRSGTALHHQRCNREHEFVPARSAPCARRSP